MLILNTITIQDLIFVIGVTAWLLIFGIHFFISERKKKRIRKKLK